MYTVESMKLMAKKLPAYSQLDEDDDDYLDDEHDDGPLSYELTGKYQTFNYDELKERIAEALNPEESYILYRGTSSMGVVNMLNNQS